MYIHVCISVFLHTYIYIYMYIYMCIYIYISIQRERERERETYTYIYTIYIYIYIFIDICMWLGMPQNSPCQEVSHLRNVGPCHPNGMVFDPDRGSNGACPGMDLPAIPFGATLWGLQAAGMRRQLPELRSPLGLASNALVVL